MAKRFTGTVVSDKMEKTAVVGIERTFQHPLYEKTLRRTRRFKVDNRLGASEGDRVVIEETRPLSKEKRWKIVEIVS